MHPGREPARQIRLATLGFWLVAAAAGATPSSVGQWSAVQRWPEPATHSILLPTGKVLWWGEFAITSVHLWDPSTNAQALLPLPGYNPFCGGHGYLEDGRLLVAGGHIDDNQGEPKASLFDPVAQTWTRLPDMNAGRWYPTVTTLPDGDLVVVAGSTVDILTPNPLPQVWDVKGGAWRDLTGASLSLPFYPFLFAAPNGQVFYAGRQRQSRYLDTSGEGSWTNLTSSSEPDREAGSAVLYAPGKVLMAGGDDPPKQSAEVIDLSQSRPRWRTVEPMALPRRQHNLTVLPDGKVLAVGGSCGLGKSNEACPVLEPELWDPETEVFTKVASSAVFRGYHSSALLLPDGRVLLAGGVKTGSAELYSPPYLFRGRRPELGELAARVGYGQALTVPSPDAKDISRVTLLRPGAGTHGFDQSQRFMDLDFTATEGALSVFTPAASTLAPPGPYLLFVLNRDGVPSKGRFVTLSLAAPGPPLPPKLTVVAPNGGEILRTARSTTVRWTSQGLVPAVSLDWSGDDGRTWSSIVSQVPNVGSYSWTVPSRQTQRARVRVSAGAAVDESDLPFSIELGECEACPAGSPCPGGLACLAGRCRRPCELDAAEGCACQSGPAGNGCACAGELSGEADRCEPLGSGQYPVCEQGLVCQEGRCQSVAPEPAALRPPKSKGCSSLPGPLLGGLGLWALWRRSRVRRG